MHTQFSGVVIEWRGPAPYYFAALSAEASDAVGAVAVTASYGWGCIPVTATVGETTWTTSLIPKDGGYLLPLRKNVRDALGIDSGTRVDVCLELAA